MRYKYRENSKSRAVTSFYAVITFLFLAFALLILGLMVASVIDVFSSCISCPGGLSPHMFFIWAVLFAFALFLAGLAASYHVSKDSKHYTKKFKKWYLRGEMQQALLGLHVFWHSAKDWLKSER